MASRFLVATGNFNSTSVWSATSGGASGVSVPTASDDVFLNAASGAVTLTINAASACQSFDCTGFTGTVTHNSGITLSVGGAAAGAYKLVSGMTYTAVNSTSSATHFVSTVTGNTIATGGKSLGNVTFNGAGGGWTLQETFNTTTNATITLTAGSLDTNNQTVTTNGILSSNSNVRSLVLGSSNITCSGSSNAWGFSTTTNLTFNAGTSTLNFTSNSSATTIIAGALTLYNAIFTNGSPITFSSALTFNDLTFSVPGLSNGHSLTLLDNLTVNGTLSASGTATNRFYISSSPRGTARTVTAAIVSFTQVDFSDITAAGAAAPFSGTSLGDGIGNSNITFPASVTRYWVGGGGSWSQTSHWAAASGGASGATVPLIHDGVIIDANSVTTAGQTIDINMPRPGKNLDFSAIANNPVVNVSSSHTLVLFGSLIFGTSMSINANWGNGFRFVGRGNHVVTLAGKSINTGSGVSVDAVNGTYTFTDNFTITTGIAFTSGTFTANANITCSSFVSSTSAASRTLQMGSGTWSLTATAGNPWSITAPNITVDAGTSTIAIATTSGSSRSLFMGNFTYNRLDYTVAGSSAGALQVSGGPTIGTFNASGGTRTIQFAAGTTTTFTNAFNVDGTPGNLISINSTSTSVTTFSKTGGTVRVTYASIQRITATGGATWYAFDSTNVGSNTGWIFAKLFEGWGVPIAL